ncbi:MAG: protein kinase [Burkholderiaceae bacterium]|nr:protein kinase [Burkholderiaceae bacterium]
MPPAESLPDDERTRPVPRPAQAAPAAGSGNALPAGTYLGEFELLGVVGEGGFGIVYRAWDHSLQRQVAVKEYMPASIALRSNGTQVSVKSERHAETFEAGLKSFVKEAQMLAQFDHPALVKVYRFWEANGSAYMVMPFYEGKTLRDELRGRSSRPDEAEVLGWIGPVADALAVIHAEHWYHRDIAPDNILLLAGSGRPLLLDFGAARRVIGDMTQALTVILKPGYAPVEQYAEVPGMKQGPWTDVYALAAVAHFAVRGRTPPPSVGRLLNDSYEPLAGQAVAGCGAAFLAAIDHGLAVRPEQRTPSIAAFKAELGLGASPTDAPSAAATAYPGLAAPAQPAAGGAALPVTVKATVAARAPGPTAVLPTPAPAPAAPAAVAAGAAANPGAAAARRAPAPALWAGLGGAALLLAGGLWWFMRAGAPAPSAVPAAPPLAALPVAAGPEAASAAVAGPVPAAVSFDVAGEFGRVVQAQTPGYGLDLQLDRTPLRIDRDKLQFTLRSLQEGHVYVLSHGSDGQLQQLYPNGLTPAPRIAKGGLLKLPQGRLEFNVSGPAGVNQLLVLVSRWPREHTAAGAKDVGGFLSFPVGAEAAQRLAAHRGPLPLLAGRAQCPASGPCEDAYGAALISYDVVP